MKDEDSRKLKSAISGMLIVDKPVGMTSHDVVAVIRKGTGLRRIGHTGTLDPRASGVLVVLIGPAVRLSEYLLSSKKGYEAIIRFGSISNTYDGDGEITSTGGKIPKSEAAIRKAMKKFTGEFDQIPPVYSAIKVHGQKACDMARKGKEIDLHARHVNVYSFDLVEYAPPEMTADILCSAGTYVRSIAHDLGEELGCGAYLSGLRRTVCGNFSLRNAIPLDDLKKAFLDGTWYQHLIPAAEAMSSYEEVLLDFQTEADIRHGRRIPAEPGDHSLAQAVSIQGEMIGMLEFCPDTCEWKPRKVFYQ